ncbi:MAG: glycerol kinase [Gammaproteobacteria bacterium]|nr:MAG: glycerol kinase [Gammaproteobacteria bacterium]
MNTYLLAIDQGTTSSRAIVFNQRGEVCGVGQQPFPQHFPEDGWVEHDPEDIWSTTVATLRQSLEDAGIDAKQVAGAGITNQRETVVVWERSSGRAIYNAIVWQDRRTARLCQQLKEAGHEADVTRRTGLLLDPYFSATKIAWLLDHVEGARERAERGELCVGTVDTFLLWRLTRGRVHATDASNASRTLLFNIHTQQWDDALLDLFRVPRALLPDVRDSAADYGSLDPEVLGHAIPVGGIAGDQQAALVGQAGLKPGQIKSTYGTGCFMILNTGEDAVTSRSRLLTTVAYRLGGQATYALEGSIFNAGTAVQWLRDGLGIIREAADTQAAAERIGPNNPVYMVPAFTGLGAPYWDAEARGALIGLTRDTSADHIITAAVQAVAYQTRDLVEAMRQDAGDIARMRVDGGMVVNSWAMQFLADMIGMPVDRPQVTETTALGAAMLAGLQVGVIPDVEALHRIWQCEHTFESMMPEMQRQSLYDGWQAAVQRVRCQKA